MRIHRFILATSAIVAALFFGGAYWALDRVFDNIVRDNAARSSESAARITFAAMYQLMSKGWSRSQADNFLRDVANAGADDSMQVQIYRGGAVEELLKYRGMERVVLAELDAQVVEAARQHLKEVHRGAFDDPRLEVRIGDGLQLLAATDERFDLVLMDLTDPDTPAETLYTQEALQRMKRVLAPGGAVVQHLGSPVFHPDQVRQLAASLRQVFAQVHCYGLYIPLYGAYWGLAVASDSLQPALLSAEGAAQRLADRGVGDLQFYNAPLHPALFALPTYYRDLVAETEAAPVQMLDLVMQA